MKIAFIEVADDININWCPNLFYALAKRDLENSGHKCNILRISKKDILDNPMVRNEFIEHLRNEKYNLAGIQSSIFIYVCDMLKEKKIKVLIGGSNALASIEESFDFLLHGSGRVSVNKLVEHLEGKCKVSDVPNLFFRKNYG